MTTSNVNEQLLAQGSAPAAAERPLRRSFLTGKVVDPELHPPLRARIERRLARTLRHR